jgi:hypothetical protein
MAWLWLSKLPREAETLDWSKHMTEIERIILSMGAVCVLAPVVVAAWPAFSSAVLAAAASLGYQASSEMARSLKGPSPQKKTESITLDVPNTEVVTGQLGRDQRLSVTRDGVTITFSRDARGKAALCVTGTGQSDEILRALGEELSGAVVQQYVYRKLMDEMQARGFVVVEQETSQDRAIHIKVRHWQS